MGDHHPRGPAKVTAANSVSCRQMCGTPLGVPHIVRLPQARVPGTTSSWSTPPSTRCWTATAVVRMCGGPRPGRALGLRLLGRRYTSRSPAGRDPETAVTLLADLEKISFTGLLSKTAKARLQAAEDDVEAEVRSWPPRSYCRRRRGGGGRSRALLPDARSCRLSCPDCHAGGLVPRPRRRRTLFHWG